MLEDCGSLDPNNYKSAHDFSERDIRDFVTLFFLQVLGTSSAKLAEFKHRKLSSELIIFSTNEKLEKCYN